MTYLKFCPAVWNSAMFQSSEGIHLNSRGLSTAVPTGGQAESNLNPEMKGLNCCRKPFPRLDFVRTLQGRFLLVASHPGWCGV